MNGDENRTPGVAPEWANEETLFLIEDELPIWSRDFAADSERFGVLLATEDRMTGDGFDAMPTEVTIDLPATGSGPGPSGSVTPAEAVRLADALYAAARAAGEPHTAP